MQFSISHVLKVRHGPFVGQGPQVLVLDQVTFVCFNISNVRAESGSGGWLAPRGSVLSQGRS